MTITAAQLELLKSRQPELFARIEANEPFAEKTALGWLACQERKIGVSEEAHAPPVMAVAVKMPTWPEQVRGVPNGLLRSALFGVIKRGRRPYLERERIAAMEGIEVCYTGPRLDQGDLDVWESILHTMRECDMGSMCRSTSYHLLKLMGLRDSGKNRNTLQTRIERLRACTVTIKQGRYTYIGGLLSHAARDEVTQEWVIVLDPNMRKLFTHDQFTLIQWDARLMLAGKPLAQWLHGFYSSHASPYPLRIDTLQKLCGSETVQLKKFTQTLKKALKAIEQAISNTGENFTWVIKDGLVHVVRTPSATQQRHLTQKRRDLATSPIPFRQVPNTVPTGTEYRYDRYQVPFPQVPSTVPTGT